LTRWTEAGYGRSYEGKEDLVRGVEKVYEETEVTNGTRVFKELQDDERIATRMCDESTPV